jgi:branched-chain amino acid transport system substrate-binding protein
VSKRVAILVVAVALIGAACGQKSGVEGTAGEVVAGGGDGGGGDGGGGDAVEAGPDDKSGVSDDEIVIGLHAPVTGASPIPQETFDIGKDIYWKFLAESEPDALGGRQVRVVFRDDQFNPNRAVEVCREMVESEGAFVLVGGAGADQITACAQYADEAGVPYFSAGVNEAGLEDLSTYFALSATYAEQAPLVVDRLEELEVEKVGVVVIDTPSFEDAHSAFVGAAEDAGIEIVTDDTINKEPSDAETNTEVQKLKDAGAEAVFILASPLTYLGIANGSRNQNFEPVFIGPGITNGINQVAEFGCPAVGNGQFLSPYPELDVVDELDPDYFDAYEQFGQGEPGDDIGLALWSLNKTIRLMFDAAGDDLGRAALINAIQEGETFETGLFPPVRFSADDHFGGTGAHLLTADCGAEEYITEEQFIELPNGG